MYIFYAEVSDNDLGEAELDEFEHVEVVEMNDVELKNYLSKDNYMLTQLIYSKYKELENVK